MTLRRPAGLLAGLAAALALWQLASIALGSPVFPAPSDLVEELSVRGVGAVWTPAATTLVEAATGYAVGNLVAILVGACCVRWRRFELVGLQFAVLTCTVPVIAVGAVMTTVWSPTAVRIAIAALSVVFTTVMGTVLGLRSADARALDLMSAYGAAPRRQFALVRLPAALPALLAALRIAAPASVLGAIVGEYLGGDGGLGVAMVASQRSGAVARTWLLAVAGALLAGAGYWIVGLLGRRWAERSPLIAIPVAALPDHVASSWTRPLRALGRAAVGAVLLVAAWYVALAVVGIDAFVARTPLDVWRYLAGDPGSGAHRAELWSALLTTFGHAGVGFVVGTAAGVASAVGFRVAPRVERLVLPFAVATQAVPVVAFLPLGLVVVGRGALLAGLVAGLVSFFPALVNVDAALGRTPRAAIDLLAANGATTARRLLLARLPFAAPAILSAARIAIPASIAGALLVEWMALGDGMGDLMLGAATQFRYDLMWSAVVVVSVATLALASVAHAAERLTTSRLGLPSSVA